VEEELKGTFGRLISFVKDTEATMSTPNPDGTHTPLHQTEGLSGRDFVLSIMFKRRRLATRPFSLLRVSFNVCL
jgi:hypothetical protein